MSLLTVHTRQKVHDHWFSISVTEGELSFPLIVTPAMAPDVVVVVYAILPSETVIAHSADFTTEKCFSNKVGPRERRMRMSEHVRCG